MRRSQAAALALLAAWFAHPALAAEDVRVRVLAGGMIVVDAGQSDTGNTSVKPAAAMEIDAAMFGDFRFAGRGVVGAAPGTTLEAQSDYTFTSFMVEGEFYWKANKTLGMSALGGYVTRFDGDEGAPMTRNFPKLGLGFTAGTPSRGLGVWLGHDGVVARGGVQVMGRGMAPLPGTKGALVILVDVSLGLDPDTSRNVYRIAVVSDVGKMIAAFK